MKKIFAIAGLCALCLAVSSCASTTKLYDLKNTDLSAPAQNTVRVCNMLTWVYNTSTDFNDMNETLKEIGITRQELESFKFNGQYEKPFGRQFSVSPDYSTEQDVYSAARKQAKKIARLILKNLPPEGGSEEQE